MYRMEINKIAKNLLENKICDNCIHKCFEQGEVFYCDVNVKIKGSYAEAQPIPKEETCNKWDSLPEVVLNLKTVKLGK